MEENDEIVLIASSMAPAAVAIYANDLLLIDAKVPRLPQLRFVRPATSYFDYLSEQRRALWDGGDRIINDTFRMDDASLDALVEMARPYVPWRICPRDVVCIVLHLASSKPEP